MFPPPHPYAQLQSIQALESADQLAIHEPAFSALQHPNTLIAKPWPSMGEVPNL